MKKPLIGYSISEEELKEFSENKDKFPFQTFELGRETKSRYNIKKILTRIKEPFFNIPLSIHSNLGLLFSCERWEHPEFRQAEIHLLKADILSSEICGIDKIIFHLDNKILSEQEKTLIKDVFEFGKRHNVKLIIETNSFSKAEYIFDFLDSFPEAEHCIDLGHLNTSIQGNTLGVTLNEYIERVKDRVTHIHAHNNFGDYDSHNLIDEGNFPYGEVLTKLTQVERIICESHNLEDSLHNKKILDELYK